MQHQSPLVWGQHYDLPVDHGEGGRGGIPVPQFSPRCVLLCDLAVTLVGYLAIRGATLEAVVGCSDALLSPPLLQYAPNAPFGMRPFGWRALVALAAPLERGGVEKGLRNR